MKWYIVEPGKEKREVSMKQGMAWLKSHQDYTYVWVAGCCSISKQT